MTHHLSYVPEVTMRLCRSCHSKVHHRNPAFADLYPKDTGHTSIRVSWGTKDRMRETVTDRGFPDAISDGDALDLIVQWVEKYVPRSMTL